MCLTHIFIQIMLSPITKQSFNPQEVGIYERKQESKKEKTVSIKKATKKMIKKKRKFLE